MHVVYGFTYMQSVSWDTFIARENIHERQPYFGVPQRSRTSNLPLRRRLLYPIELAEQVVPSEGLEPATHRLKAGCSTIELRRHVAGQVGLEPTTIRLTAERSTIELLTIAQPKKVYLKEMKLMYSKTQSLFWQLREMLHKCPPPDVTF